MQFIMTNEEKLIQFEKYSFDVCEQLFEKYEGDLEKMPAQDQDVVLIWRLEADMYNGGFVQFFCNWGFENYAKTLDVLEKLGATKTIEILVECENTISFLKDDDRLKELWDIPKYLSDEHSKKLNELDEQYWDNPDELQSLCYDRYMQ